MEIEYVNNENKKVYDKYVKENGNLFQTLEWIKSNEIDEYNALIISKEKEVYMSAAYIIT